MNNSFEKKLRDIYKKGLDLAKQDKIDEKSLSQLYKRKTLLDSMKSVLEEGIGILPKSMTDEDQVSIKTLEKQIKTISEEYEQTENYGMNTTQEIPNIIDDYKKVISSGEQNDVFIEFLPHFENDETFLNTLIEKLQKNGHSIKLLHTHTPDLEAEDGLSNKTLYVSMKSSDYAKYTELFRNKKENGENYSGSINASFVPPLVNKQFHNYEVSEIIEDKIKSDETVRFNRFGLGSMPINGNSEYSNNPSVFSTSDSELNHTMRKTFEITFKNITKEFDNTFFPAPYTYSKEAGVINGGTRVDMDGEIDLFDRKNPQPKRRFKNSN